MLFYLDANALGWGSVRGGLDGGGAVRMGAGVRVVVVLGTGLVEMGRRWTCGVVAGVVCW